MDPIVFDERPTLSQPSVICAFGGWNDGGEAASGAARYLMDRWGATPFAHLDPEEFYDFQVTRPQVRLRGGVSRMIDWPRGEFAAATVDGRDIVVFTAAEPNVRWKTFAGAIVEAARGIGSGLLVTLGAFLTDIPHTRPVPVVGSAGDEDTADRLGLARSQYEGPTGIVGVLHDTANRDGVPSVSLWAAVPHYLPAGPNPKASLALVRRTAALLDVTIETGPLERAAAAWEDGVLDLVKESDELSEYLARLEEAADQPGRAAVEGSEGGAGELLSDRPLPSGDAIAAEVERFLRERGED